MKSTPTLSSFCIAILFAGLISARSGAENQVDIGDTTNLAGEYLMLAIGVTKEDPVVGVQFVFHYNPNSTTSSRPFVASTSSNHELSFSDDLEGLQTIVVFSRTNEQIPADFELRLPLGTNQMSHPLGPEVSVDQVIFTDESGAEISGVASYSFVDRWRRTHFTEAERADLEVVANDRDPDGDGLSNFFEMATGSDPRKADEAERIESDIVEGGSGEEFVRLHFWRPKDDTLELLTRVEITSDFESWLVDPTVLIEPTGVVAGDYEQVRALKVIEPSTALYFFRFSVISLDP